MSNEVEFTDDNFKSETGSGVTLVDFWAPWCQPCKVISPIVEELAEEDDRGIAFAKVNIDDNPRSPVKYGIMGVPTLLFFREGDLVERIVGN